MDILGQSPALLAWRGHPEAPSDDLRPFFVLLPDPAVATSDSRTSS